MIFQPQAKAHFLVHAWRHFPAVSASPQLITTETSEPFSPPPGNPLERLRHLRPFPAFTLSVSLPGVFYFSMVNGLWQQRSKGRCLSSPDTPRSSWDLPVPFLGQKDGDFMWSRMALSGEEKRPRAKSPSGAQAACILREDKTKHEKTTFSWTPTLVPGEKTLPHSLAVWCG